MSNAWLFQIDPKQATRFTLKVGHTDDWDVARYRSEISNGDTTIIWQGGDNGGMVALGEVVAESVYRDVPAFPDRKFWVRIRYTRILTKTFPRNDVKNIPALHYMQIISIPFAKNAFAVTAAEWEEIKERLGIL